MRDAEAPAAATLQHAVNLDHLIAEYVDLTPGRELMAWLEGYLGAPPGADDLRWVLVRYEAGIQATVATPLAAANGELCVGITGAVRTAARELLRCLAPPDEEPGDPGLLEAQRGWLSEVAEHAAPLHATRRRLAEHAARLQSDAEWESI